MTKNKYIKKVSYARVGLLGNPSDHYGGKCLSFTFDKKAEVTIEDDDKLEIDGKNHKSFNLIYDGSNDLIKAVIKNLKLSSYIMHEDKLMVQIETQEVKKELKQK